MFEERPALCHDLLVKLNQPVLVTDRQGCCVWANGQAKDFLGEKIEGLSVGELFHFSRGRLRQRQRWRQVLNGDREAASFTVTHREGTVIEWRCACSQIDRGELQRPIVLLGTARPEAPPPGEGGKYQDKIRTLHQLAFDLTKSNSEEEIHRLSIGAAESILDFPFGFISEVEGEWFHAKAVSSRFPETADDMEPKHISSGIVGKTYRTGESYVCNDMEQNSEADPARPDFRSILSVPIGEQGVFQAVSRQPGAFDDEDLELAELLVAHLNQNLERMRSQRRLKERHERITELYRASSALQAAETKADVFEIMIRAAEEVLDFDLCAVSAARNEGLVPQAASSGVPSQGVGAFPYGEGISGRTYEEQKIFTFDDMRQVDFARPQHSEYRSIISVPLGRHGVFQTVSEKVGAFEQIDVELAGLLGVHGTVTLNRLEYEEELKERNRHISRLAAEYQAILDTTQDFLFLVDVDEDGEFRYRRVNEAHERELGYKTEELEGKTPIEAVGQEMGSDIEGHLRRCVESKDDISYRRRMRLGDKEWVLDIKLGPVIKDGKVVQIVGSSRDVTELTRQRRQIEELNSLLASIRDINQMIVKETNPEDMLQQACQILLEARDYRLVWVAKALPGGQVQAVAKAGAHQDYVDEIEVSWDDAPEGRGPVGTAVREGRPAVQEDIAEAPEFEPWRKPARDHGFASSIAVPIHRGKEIFGTLNVYCPQKSDFSSDVELLSELANDLGFALDKYEAEKKLRESERRYRTVFENTGAGTIIIEEDMTISLVNREMERLSGYSAEEIENKMKWTEFVAEKDLDRLEQYHWARRREGGEAPQRYEATLVDRDGNAKDMLFSVGMIPGSRKSVASLVDISRQKEMERRLESLSFHDRLTNLRNRNYVEEEMERLNAEENLPLSVLMGDLNGLKLVNDGFGYDRGDRLLREAAYILAQHTGEEDVVARWGGDEFILFLSNTTRHQAEKRVESITEACQKTDEDPIRISLSFGVAVKKEPQEDIWSTIKAAQDRMHRNKLLASKRVRESLVSSLTEILRKERGEPPAHMKNMERLGRKLGKRLELSESQMRNLSLLARLHDVGKVAIDKSILFKRDDLSKREWELIKTHCAVGSRIVESIPDLARISQAVLSHHERWDGCGYPRGLAGDEIPLLARIIAVLDAYDVMKRGRSYQEPVTTEESLDELSRQAGRQFDPRVVDVFMTMMEEDKEQ